MSSGAGTNSGELSDDEAEVLVERMGRGDRAALELLFRAYSNRLLGLGLRILGDRNDAEEVLHEVFLEAWRAARSYDRARGTVRTWFSVRMRSRSLDRRKSNRPGRFVPSEDALSTFVAETDEGDPTRSFDTNKMAAALRHLSPEQREVLALGYFEGLSSTEIADALGIPLGTVKSRVRQSLLRLRELLLEGAESRAPHDDAIERSRPETGTTGSGSFEGGEP